MAAQTMFSTVSGFALGLIAGYFLSVELNESESDTDELAERLSTVESQIVSFQTLIADLTSVVSDLPQQLQAISQTSVNQSESAAGQIADISPDSSYQNSSVKEKPGLTSMQQERYDSLAVRIDDAPYGGLTLSELISAMEGFPKEYQDRLLNKVGVLINSGQLDPQGFAEGNY